MNDYTVLGSGVVDNCMELFLMQSGGEYSVNRSYKTRGINRNSYYVKIINQLSPLTAVMNQSVGFLNIPVFV